MSYYSENRQDILQKQKIYREQNREYTLWQNCKHRAKRKGLEFTLALKDIVVPSHCPILGCELVFGSDTKRGCSPSVDRIDSTKGYTPDNIQIISQKANTIKSDATPEEILAVAQYLKNHWPPSGASLGNSC